jgi:hypothetical protein
MIVLGPLLAIVSIGFLCWLLFTLAVFALPFFVGLTVAMWAFHAGASVSGSMLVGILASGATLGLPRLAVAFVPWAWLRLLTILLFVAPASAAGYSATRGIAQMVTPSVAQQTILSVVGAAVFSIAAFVRFAGKALPGPAGLGVARG